MEKTIRWKVNSDEMVKIHALGAEAAGLNRPSNFIALIFLEILFIIIFLSTFRPPALDWRHAVISFLMALIIPCLAVYRYWFTPRRIRAMYPANNRLAGEYTLTFTDEYYLVRGPNGEAKAAWSSFRRWRESGDYLFLFQDNGLINYLPKDKLDAELMGFIQEKIETNRLPKNPSKGSRMYNVAICAIVVILVVILIVWNIQNAAPR